MTETMEKPVFEVNKGLITMSVNDVDGSELVFNAQEVGPFNYFELRGAQYGPEGTDFEAPSFGEIVPLVHAALRTGGDTDEATDEAKRVVETLKDYWTTGKTIALTGREGIFTDDNPDLELVRGDLQKYENFLKDRLGSREENGVIYSDNGLVRFTPYGFQQRKQKALDFSKNRGLIVLVGNGGRADMLAKASGHYALKPWLGLGEGFTRTDSPQLQVPGVGGGIFSHQMLNVRVGDPDCHDRYSFGVRKCA